MLKALTRTLLLQLGLQFGFSKSEMNILFQNQLLCFQMKYFILIFLLWEYWGFCCAPSAWYKFLLLSVSFLTCYNELSKVYNLVL